MANGAIIYQGPSALDGQPIVAIATGLAKSSSNVKTGNMIQVWIIRSDMKPTDANHAGADASICGACPHRGVLETVDGITRNVGRTCYVTVFQAPLSVYKTFAAGKYAASSDAGLFAGRNVRIGAYGDPAAVPFSVWQMFLPAADAITGYTHQWRNAIELKAWCMASCDTVADHAAAKSDGWRTFRVRTLADPVLAREVICPASAEAGKRTTCALCRACGGASSKAKADIVIALH